MMASTEQERAEFEAWRIGELRKAIGRPVHLQSDDDLRRVFLRLNGSGQYADNQEQQRFEAWQAALHAQVVPQGWKLVKDSTHEERALFEANDAVYFPRVGSEREPLLPEIYTDMRKQERWETWKAARRAPGAAPTVTQVEEAVGMAATAWDCIPPQSIIDAVLALSRQPEIQAKVCKTGIQRIGCIEAAPVQLPGCAGKVLSPQDYDDGSISWRGGMPPEKGTNLYTEQQVRKLLATKTHGA